MQVPSGATNYLPSKRFPILAGQKVNVLGVQYYSRTAGATFEVELNGSSIGGSWTTTTSWQTDTTSVFPIALADGDYMQPVVTAISGTPDGLGVGIIYEVIP